MVALPAPPMFGGKLWAASPESKLAFALSLSGLLDVIGLRRALDEIVARDEIPRRALCRNRCGPAQQHDSLVRQRPGASTEMKAEQPLSTSWPTLDVRGSRRTSTRMSLRCAGSGSGRNDRGAEPATLAQVTFARRNGHRASERFEGLSSHCSMRGAAAEASERPLRYGCPSGVMPISPGDLTPQIATDYLSW